MKTTTPITTPITTAAARSAPLLAELVGHLADPEEMFRRYQLKFWWPQALASGALGIALLHVERARSGDGPWDHAHRWLRYAAASPVVMGPGSHLHFGAPALAHVLHHASTSPGGSGSYTSVLAGLDTQIATLTVARLEHAHRRIDAGAPAPLAEFDVLRGLAGLGTYWLRRDPTGPHLSAILTYLVRLTEPHREPSSSVSDDRERPGWWTDLAPNGRRTAEFPHGHTNNGLAHGIAGPLALLALATRAGVHVPGQTDAIRRVLAWFDAHEHRDTAQTWWPRWIIDHGVTSPPTQRGSGPPRSGDQDDPAADGPGRPSWCYGAPGIARAQQLAGLVLGDSARAAAGEAALITATTLPDLAARLDGSALCHGLAGLLHITTRAAADSDNHRLVHRVTALRQLTEDNAEARLRAGTLDHGAGLLDGTAGIALALQSAGRPVEGPGWDTCLLIS